MFGRPEWFTHRVVGWGIAPRTWQGWVYLLTFLGLLFGAILSPIPDGPKQLITVTLVGLFVADALVMWSQLDAVHDERSRMHQLIIERNCSLAAVLTVVAVVAYQIYRNRDMAGGALPFDPMLLVVLGAMALTKLVSGIYLQWRM